MRTSDKRVRMLVAAGLGAVLAAGQGVGFATAQSVPAAQPAPVAPGPAAPAKSPPAATAKAPSGDAALRQRVEQLEEQLVDLQVVIGTLESLARSGASNASAASAVAGASAADSARLQGIEQQVRALAAQLDQLSAEVRGGARPDRRSDAGAMSPPAAPPATGQAGVQFGAPPAATGTNSFSSTTVTSSQDDPIGGLIDTGAMPGATAKTGEALPDISQPAGGPAAPGAVAALPPADGSNPKLAYEQAYGNLLRQDYGAAQAGFADFLRRYPNESLAPDALFWLGETHYVQRNYADAAEAFALVTSSFASSGKAPEAQLKRAMALNMLGKKDEACAALRQLNSKFPSARAQLKSKADSERQKAGCV